ncbi:MAG TPA: hypothetical protein VMB03_32015 [Bryobacteraceae bacterium]|nr:hypothetical protein [Bryobacteraceae bacterium]
MAAIYATLGDRNEAFNGWNALTSGASYGSLVWAACKWPLV